MLPVFAVAVRDPGPWPRSGASAEGRKRHNRERSEERQRWRRRGRRSFQGKGSLNARAKTAPAMAQSAATSHVAARWVSPAHLQRDFDGVRAGASYTSSGWPPSLGSAAACAHKTRGAMTRSRRDPHLDGNGLAPRPRALSLNSRLEDAASPSIPCPNGDDDSREAGRPEGRARETP